MKKFWIGFLAGVLFSLLAMVIFSFFVARMMGLDDEGLPGPDLSKMESKQNFQYDLLLRNLLNDSSVNNDRLKGKVIFLNFWEHWCVPCKEEMPSLQRLYNTVCDSLFFFGLVSTESPELTRKDKMITKHSIPFYYTDKIIPAILKSDIVPRSYIIDKNGNVVVAETGAVEWDDPRVVKLIDSLKAVK